MNLYRIKVLHGAPKDSHTSIETYLIAPDDEAVAEWINDHLQSGFWFDEDTLEVEDGYASAEGVTRTKCQYIMAHKGDLDDEHGWEDAYYGVTKYGWEQVQFNLSDEDRSVIVRLNIAVYDNQAPKRS